MLPLPLLRQPHPHPQGITCVKLGWRRTASSSGVDESRSDEDNSPVAKISAILANPNAAPAGQCSFGGPATSLPGIPGLEVDGFGTVALPLVDPVAASRLAACGHAAPFGHGLETLTDPSVRRTWEFRKSQVKLTNPAWHQGLVPLAQTIAERLGCRGMPLELRLYKFLMYETGCHFVKHRDTEKDDRMFATLVIQLPSVHQGGQLVVHHPNGIGISHDFGHAAGTAAYAPHYAVHFADSEHEVLPVTAGYRLALVYSICWPVGRRQLGLLRAHDSSEKIDDENVSGPSMSCSSRGDE